MPQRGLLGPLSSYILRRVEEGSQTLALQACLHPILLGWRFAGEVACWGLGRALPLTWLLNRCGPWRDDSRAPLNLLLQVLSVINFPLGLDRFVQCKFDVAGSRVDEAKQVSSGLLEVTLTVHLTQETPFQTLFHLIIHDRARKTEV